MLSTLIAFMAMLGISAILLDSNKRWEIIGGWVVLAIALCLIPTLLQDFANFAATFGTGE